MPRFGGCNCEDATVLTHSEPWCTVAVRATEEQPGWQPLDTWWMM